MIAFIYRLSRCRAGKFLNSYAHVDITILYAQILPNSYKLNGAIMYHV